jgi:hypothetical protein
MIIYTYMYTNIHIHITYAYIYTNMHMQYLLLCNVGLRVYEVGFKEYHKHAHAVPPPLSFPWPS